MDRETARRISPGDYVVFAGRVYRVGSISTHGLASPYFGLNGQGRVSYEICHPATAVEIAEAIIRREA